MIKIKYKGDRNALSREYISALSLGPDVLLRYQNLRNELIDVLPEHMEEVLVLPIDALALLSSNINVYLRENNMDFSEYKSRIKDVFEYGSKQSYIANFFMKHTKEISLKTCYYCNIGFVNRFKDIGDYKDPLDFVRRAKDDELKKIKGIKRRTVQRIGGYRASVNNLEELELDNDQLVNLKEFVVNKMYNHFTLDHVLSQVAHPVTALSLYNFVPCCYSCNSKFKGKKAIVQNQQSCILSPTNIGFSFNDVVRFRIFDNINFRNVFNSKASFVIRPVYLVDNPPYKNLVEIFKLEGRYASHKNEASLLIGKSVKYNRVKIREMAKLLRIPEAKVKADIFGRNLFEGALEDAPFTKYLRDIADNIGIKGVKTTD